MVMVMVVVVVGGGGGDDPRYSSSRRSRGGITDVLLDFLMQPCLSCFVRSQCYIIVATNGAAPVIYLQDRVILIARERIKALLLLLAPMVCWPG